MEKSDTYGAEIEPLEYPTNFTIRVKRDLDRELITKYFLDFLDCAEKQIPKDRDILINFDFEGVSPRFPNK